MQQRVDTEALGKLVRSAKRIAKQCRKLQGKPLYLSLVKQVSTKLLKSLAG